MATPLNKMGSNMVKVFGRLKKQLDPEPRLEGMTPDYPSVAWVEWYMGQTGCDRRIAINRAYAMLGSEKTKVLSLNLTTFKTFEVDEGLKIFGINRMKDYFYTSGALLSRAVTRK